MSSSCTRTSLSASISCIFLLRLCWYSSFGWSNRKKCPTVSSLRSKVTWMRCFFAVASLVIPSRRMARVVTESLRNMPSPALYLAVRTVPMSTDSKQYETSSAGGRAGMSGRQNTTHACSSASENCPVILSSFIGRFSSTFCTRCCKQSGLMRYEQIWLVFGATRGMTNACTVPKCPSTARILISMRLEVSWQRYVARQKFPFSGSGGDCDIMATFASVSSSSTGTSLWTAMVKMGIGLSIVSA
mmetsp:Transcript_24955/g.54317  ORF Transcript_24955/g.54317 Transcript_24955/m.54317 type:complete len:244 (+) Transcript_24955:669-1400(+)